MCRHENGAETFSLFCTKTKWKYDINRILQNRNGNENVLVETKRKWNNMFRHNRQGNDISVSCKYEFLVLGLMCMAKFSRPIT
jgi:hypothetical protein